MGLLTGLFRTMRKKLSLTQDTDMGAFRDKIKALVEEKDTLDEGAVVERVTELIAMTEDLPDGEDKEKLKRYLEDFKSIKSQEPEVAMEASKAVADLFEKLDKDAMEGDLGIEPAPAEEKVEEEAIVEEPAPDLEGEPAPEEEVKAEEEIKADDTGEEVQEEEKAEEEIKTEDADPDPEYSMEEIYQFIKKRMAEDAEAPAEGEEVEEEKEEVTEEETEDCNTKDHGMPGITLGGTSAPAAKGGLNELYKTMKGE